ncbi:UDP-glucose dehydrogenase family protein [Paenibacillus humicola]|uniref:UDP-glucose dehydrogenase family protein n=1 Tax=Paenibacillus humicola TaxID=3110540 RepID=UPI00237A7023|nr:UDP-glucose/GDP-mannose dehydrogenase family protein [Paenibacillus humicola]
MNISVIGSGYVGLVSGVCYSELGNNVYCVDKDTGKIEKLCNGEVPIYEPGLQQLIIKNTKNNKLKFTTDIKKAVSESEIIIIAVGTPSLSNGEADLQYIETAAMEISKAMNGYKVICVKSTVPVGTNERVQKIVSTYYKGKFDVASLPEFLREGTAIKDSFNPDRIIIGTDSLAAKKLLIELHSALCNEIIITDRRSAEMIKYASNAFLATKISFINEVANICEKVGADVIEVAKGMGLDRRIGTSFLRAGIGYGGSCFPKDTKALIQIAGNVEYDFKLLKAVVEVNRNQRLGVLDKLFQALDNVYGKTIGIWGLSFKPETDDVREAPALEIIEKLIELGSHVKVYDPIAMECFRQIFNHPAITWCETAMEVAHESEALCLLTEWNEFVEVDLIQVEKALARPILIDGRNVFSFDQIRKTGLAYYPVGRPVFQNIKSEEVL